MEKSRKKIFYFSLIFFIFFAFSYSQGICEQKIIKLLPLKEEQIASPNGKSFLLQNLKDANTPCGHIGELFYKETANSSPQSLFTYGRWIEILWSGKGEAVLFNEYPNGDISRCYIFTLGKEIRKYELGALFKEKFPTETDHFFISGLEWVDDKTVRVMVLGDKKNNSMVFERYFFYQIDKGFTEIKSPSDEKPNGVKKAGNNENVVGDCFTFKGRAAFYNGNPTLRIWRIGTKRILGVEGFKDGEGYNVGAPKNLYVALEDFRNFVYGQFTVCPLTPFKPGVMQMIRIESVKITKIVSTGSE